MKRVWNIKKYDKEKAANLAAEMGISQLLAGILINRGIDTKGKAEAFLHPENTEYHDPMLLPDMDKAVNRIAKALRNKEHITIYGDYDADGTTATTIMLMNLKALGGIVDFYVPDRFAEGYGLKTKALEQLKEQGTTLVITVDCGISSVEEIAAMQGNLDIIVTDHHLPGESLPRALAVVDAHLKHSRYPFHGLCGAGVAYKLCQALRRRLGKKAEPLGIELAALGTVADMVPLRDENRKLVKTGLKKMERTNIVGLRALIEAAGCSGKPLKGFSIGFILGPRINAVGRLKHASRVIELLTCKDNIIAERMAQEINELNFKRKETQLEIQEIAEKQLGNVDMAKAKVIVVSGEGWNQGVNGLVASGLLNVYYRPTIVISIKDGVGRGSCRSIQGFNMFNALAECKDILVQYGGHEMAAGLTIDPANIPALRDRLNAYAKAHMTAEQFLPSADIDAEINPLEITTKMAKELELLEPCGQDNNVPIFAYRGLRGAYARSMGQDGRHMSFSIEDRAKHKSMRAIAFGQSDYVETVNREPVDVVYYPEINVFRDEESVQIKVDSFEGPIIEAQSVKPNRNFVAAVFVHIRDGERALHPVSAEADQLAVELRLKNIACDAESVKLALMVLDEIGLLVVDKENNVCHLRQVKEKLRLENSYTYSQYNSAKMSPTSISGGYLMEKTLKD